jgi:hypothetical protein
VDPQLIRIFQIQVLAQCDCVLMAATQVDASLEASDIHGLFFALQGLLTAAANAAKALWGSGNRLDVAARRKPLRDSIGVDDTSPLRAVSMRNNFEHIDDRIDAWWNHGASRMYVDFQLGPQSAIGGTPATSIFRSYDPATHHVSFWDQTFDVRALVAEVNRILPKLNEEANKASWGP